MTREGGGGGKGLENTMTREGGEGGGKGSESTMTRERVQRAP